MRSIIEVRGREVIDSRGTPTVEAEVILADGSRGVATVPSGASTGTYEAIEMRDGDMDRYFGKGVKKAVSNVNGTIAKALNGMPATGQQAIDAKMIELDGTSNKSKLGANATLAVSLACARAASNSLELPLYSYLGGPSANLLPVPLMNLINGGAHADNGLDLQEFMVLPTGFDSYRDALRAGCEIYHTLKQILTERGYGANVGDEGGYAPQIEDDRMALQVLVDATEQAGYAPGTEVLYALDCASNELYEDGRYNMGTMGQLNSAQMREYYASLAEEFPIVSIEDPFHEDGWMAWISFSAGEGAGLQVVGDDLLVTNNERLRRAIEEKACNSILVKLNQIGTLSETLECIEIAHRVGFTSIISHRSGESADTFISHLAVAVNSGQIKAGAPARADRVSKYNELLRIEHLLGDQARYAGRLLASRFGK